MICDYCTYNHTLEHHTRRKNNFEQQFTLHRSLVILNDYLLVTSQHPHRILKSKYTNIFYCYYFLEFFFFFFFSKKAILIRIICCKNGMKARTKNKTLYIKCWYVYSFFILSSDFRFDSVFFLAFCFVFLIRFCLIVSRTHF